MSDMSPLSTLHLASLTKPTARNVRPSVKLTVNADGSVSLPAPRWTDGTFVAPSSTSPAGGVLDAKRGVITWKGYDAKASYPYDFDRGGMFRLYNPNSGERFYTGNAVEKNHLAAIGWTREGIAWYAVHA